MSAYTMRGGRNPLSPTLSPASRGRGRILRAEVAGGSQQPLVAAIGIARLAAGAGRTSPRPRLRRHGGARPGRAAPGGQRRTRQLEAARARAAVEPELVVDVLDAEDVVGDVLEGALLVAALDGPRERHLAGRDRHLHLAGVDPAAGDPLAHLVADPLVGAAVPLRPEAAPPREGIAPLPGGLVEARVDPACAAARPDVPVLAVRGAAPRPAIPLLALASHRSLSSRRVADGRAKGKLHTRATRAPSRHHRVQRRALPGAAGASRVQRAADGNPWRSTAAPSRAPTRRSRSPGRAAGASRPCRGSG